MFSRSAAEAFFAQRSFSVVVAVVRLFVLLAKVQFVVPASVPPPRSPDVTLMHCTAGWDAEVRTGHAVTRTSRSGEPWLSRSVAVLTGQRLVASLCT